MRGTTARATGPAWAPAPRWSPEDGPEQREVFDAVRRELEDANRNGRGRQFDPGEVLRLPYEHVRRCLNLLEAATADPNYVVHDAAGHLWSSLTSPSWKWDGRLADCTDYNRAAFREVLARRRGSSGETRPAPAPPSSTATPSPRTSSRPVDERPRPAPPPSPPPPRAVDQVASKLRPGESFALEAFLVLARKQLRDELEREPGAKATLEQLAQELVRERCSKTAPDWRRDNELARARNEVLETLVKGGRAGIEARARELAEADARTRGGLA